MSAFKEILSIGLIVFFLASCKPESSQKISGTEASAISEQVQEIITAAAADIEKRETETMLGLAINGTPVTVEWENNESVQALRELAAAEPVTVQMSMYGGFEQVGSLGTSIVRDDVQTATSAGDIVLYSGSNIVIFYGSNSWAYTRLGHITDKTAGELSELLGNGDVTITISMK